MTVLVVALVLLCLLVAVVGAVNRRFEALAGRIAAVELELGRPMLVDVSAHVSAGLEGGGV